MLCRISYFWIKRNWVLEKVYHIFVLHLIIEFYPSVYKDVYCAFIDYHKAYDSINRPLH